jgi:hypothetical protein
MIEISVKFYESDLITEIVDNSTDYDIVEFISNVADRAFFNHDDIRQQIINRLQEDM